MSKRYNQRRRSKRGQTNTETGESTSSTNKGTELRKVKTS